MNSPSVSSSVTIPSMAEKRITANIGHADAHSLRISLGRGTTARLDCHCPDSAWVSFVTKPRYPGSVGTGYWQSQMPLESKASRHESMMLLRVGVLTLGKGIVGILGCLVGSVS